MTTELLDDIHPGEILLEELMKPMHTTARRTLFDKIVSRIRAFDDAARLAA